MRFKHTYHKVPLSSQRKHLEGAVVWMDLIESQVERSSFHRFHALLFCLYNILELKKLQKLQRGKKLVAAEVGNGQQKFRCFCKEVARDQYGCFHISAQCETARVVTMLVSHCDKAS